MPAVETIICKLRKTNKITKNGKINYGQAGIRISDDNTPAPSPTESQQRL